MEAKTQEWNVSSYEYELDFCLVGDTFFCIGRERLLLLLLVILLLLLFVLLLGFFLGSSLLLALSQESVIQLTRMSEEAFLVIIMRNLRCLRISGLLARSDSEPLGQLLGGAL